MAHEIPVVDIGPFLAGGDAAAEIEAGATQVGFFQVIGQGVPTGVLLADDDHPNVWPTQPAEFEPACRALFARTQVLHGAVMRLVAQALGLGVEGVVEPNASSFAVNHYPAVDVNVTADVTAGVTAEPAVFSGADGPHYEPVTAYESERSSIRAHALLPRGDELPRDPAVIDFAARAR